MKNFSELLIQQQEQIANPFLFATPEVEQEIKLGVAGKLTKLILATTVAHILTAPLQTIVTSIQLSVLPHKEIFSSVESRSKQLSKLNTELTIAEKRRLQLMIRSGGQFQPYVAPVYQGYEQAVRNIAKQGWQAFFKGLSFRLVNSIPHFGCYGLFFRDLAQNDSKKFGFFQFLTKCYGILFLTDLSMNMFHVMENRYILQNNIKQFRVFRNFVRVIGKMTTRGQLFKGVQFHAINNLAELFFRFPVFLMLFTIENITTPMLGLYYLSEALMYPVQTAYKRFICQSTAIPGMIPMRYSGIGHAIKVIMFEEKIKGLYGGFGLHSVVVFTRLMILQLFFKNVQIVEQGEF